MALEMAGDPVSADARSYLPTFLSRCKSWRHCGRDVAFSATSSYFIFSYVPVSLCSHEISDSDKFEDL